MRQRMTRMLALLAALLLAGCAEQGAIGGTAVLDGPHTYAQGQLLQGDVLVAGGQLFLEEGAQIDGSLYMLGGTVRLDGTVTGEVSIIGGSLSIGPAAVVGGDLSLGGGHVTRSEQATIRGEIVQGAAVPEAPRRGSTVGGWLLNVALQAAVLLPLALLAAHFAPRPLGRVRQAMAGYPLVAGALGFLAFNVFLALFVLMAFTIILIPVTITGILLMLLAVAYGLIAVGAILGDWLNARLAARGRALRAPAAAALGTLALVILLDLVSRIPLVGALAALLLAIVGFGAVLLTRFGFHRYAPPPEMAGPPTAAESGGERHPA